MNITGICAKARAEGWRFEYADANLFDTHQLGKRITSWCRDIIYIPTNGCLNLAACVNVVLYDRMVKLKGCP